MVNPSHSFLTYSLAMPSPNGAIHLRRLAVALSGALTGLPVEQQLLNRNPLVVSITIFPPSARPQAGLMQAADANRLTNGPYRFVIGPVRSALTCDSKTCWSPAASCCRRPIG